MNDWIVYTESSFFEGKPSNRKASSFLGSTWGSSSNLAFNHDFIIMTWPTVTARDVTLRIRNFSLSIIYAIEMEILRMVALEIF